MFYQTNFFFVVLKEMDNIIQVYLKQPEDAGGLFGSDEQNQQRVSQIIIASIIDVSLLFNRNLNILAGKEEAAKVVGSLTIKGEESR